MRDVKEFAPMHFCVPCTLLPLSLSVPHILPRSCFVMSSFPSPSLPNPLLADLAVLSSPIRLLSLLLLKACPQRKVVLTDLWWLWSESAAPPEKGITLLRSHLCVRVLCVLCFLQAVSQPSAIRGKRKRLLQGCQLESRFSKCTLFVPILGVGAVTQCTVNPCFVLV